MDFTLIEARPGVSVVLLPDAPTFTVVAVSNDFVNVLGVQREAIVGRGHFELFPHSSAEDHSTGEYNVKASYEYVIQHKEPHHLPLQRYDIPSGDGTFSERYWKAINVPVLNKAGEVQYIIHTAEDITVQVKAETRKAQNEGIEKAYNLFMQVPAIISITEGPEHILELANEGALKLWGKGKEIVGKPLLKAIPEVEGQGVIERFDKVLRTGEPFLGSEIPVATYRKGIREDLYFDVVYQPYYNEGTNVPTGVFAISHEVTELVEARRKVEESEAKYRNLFDFMVQGYCIIETLFNEEGTCIDYRYLETNPAFEKHSGLSNAVGKTVRELVPNIETHWLDLFGNVAKTGKSVRFIEESKAMNKWAEIYAMRMGDEGSIKVGVFFTDITERKKAEEALRKSESNLRNTILQAPVAMTILKSPSFVVEIVNEPMCELLGRSKEELLNKPLFDTIPDSKDQGYEDLLMSVMNTGKRFSAQGTPAVVLRKGVMETIYLDFLYEAYREADGTISGVIVVATEVTEQIKAGQKVRESEEKYHNLFDSMDQGYCTLEIIFEGERCVDYRYLETNPAFERHLGISNALGKTIREIAPDIEPKWFAYYGGVVLTGNPVYIEEESPALNKWYEVYAVRVGSAEERKVGVFFSDITKRKKGEEAIRESETRFRSLADESPMFIFIIDADPMAPVNYWNKTWLQYTGQTYEEALGRAWNGILHPDDVPVVMEHYAPAFQAREPYFIPAVRVRRHDGAYRWHAFKGNPRFLATGAFNGYIGVGFDVHEQKLAEENLEELIAQRTQDLQHANRELKRSNANLEEFAHAASHDLKEPVRKIHYFTNQLKGQLSTHLKDGQANAFNRIENATERMGNLIDDLLLYSHVSHRPHEKESVDLNEKVQQVLEDLEIDIQEKGASINVGKLPLVQGYRRQLQQLFQNLISNAVKYSKKDVPPLIKITASEVTEKGNTHHLIEVRDNGIGFEPEYADKIFQMFTRLHGKAEYSGTGVGLSIVKKVVENHNGFIRVESEVGEGSVFKVYLPA